MKQDKIIRLPAIKPHNLIKMSKLLIISILVYGIAIPAPAKISFLKSVDKPAKPNILYIMADDHATNAISSYGSRLTKIFKTPNIDRLAEEGAILTNCFVTNSICTPSRAAILTGKYSQKNGVYTLKDDFDRNQQNVAMLLQKVGYETAIIGKWHLHTQPNGFDFYNVLPGQGKYFDSKFKEIGDTWQDGNKGGNVHKGYISDVITELAINYLNHRNKNKPFFLMVHHKASHGLWEYPPRYEHLFDSVNLPEPFSLFEDKSHRSAASRNFGHDLLNLAKRMSEGKNGKDWPTGKLDVSNMNDVEKIRAAYQKYMKDYLRTVAALDENVGRLLDYLDESGLSENTVVIYTSDQGMFLGEHAYYDKRWMYEESLRMPFLIRYPPEIKAGTVCDDIVTNIDFAELFLDYAGVHPPRDMQGRSFRENLTGHTPADWRTAMYYRYWMHIKNSFVPAHYGIRTRKFKLIYFYGRGLGRNGTTDNWITPTGWELYDLENDPMELKNVYEDPAYVSVIKKLKKELNDLQKFFGDKKVNPL